MMPVVVTVCSALLTMQGLGAWAAEKETATNWWAYQDLGTVQAPAVRNSDWVRSDIDRFILAGLEGRKIAPNGDAPKAVLLRRAFYALTGLPPRPDQIETFERDNSPEAFSRVVDSLLNSPRFGEQWGRHWLDVVRYAESVTLRGFIFKEAWRYRDYVIESFNNDVPYNQFIIEQIAGDLLEAEGLNAKQRNLIATTFLALGNTNLEEQDKKQLRMDVVDEQLDVIGQAFLAQTIGCARCHDHKFDPIPTRDYYAMAGILRNARLLEDANVSSWIEVPLPLPAAEEQVFKEHEERLRKLEAEIKAAKEKLKDGAKAAPEGKTSVSSISGLRGIIVDDTQAKKVGAWKTSKFSGHFIAEGYLHDDNSGKGEKTLTFVPEIPRAGKYEVRLAYQHGGSRATRVPLNILSAEGETTLHINMQEPPPIDQRFVSLGQYRFEQNGQGFVLVSNEGTQGHVTADAVQLIAVEDLESNFSSLRSSETDVTGTKPIASELSASIKSLETELKKLTSSKKRPMVMSVKEEHPAQDIPIHMRGSVHRLGETVPRGFLQVAHRSAAATIGTNQSGRLEMASWIASADNPLTARVMVNRVWHWLFGAGLVRTVDNFGRTGEKPSHPELLDHLARRFIQQGWSVKKLVREIMLSHAYQLSSAPHPGGEEPDPENRLLYKANRRRMGAESLRDTILMASGNLQLDFRGGPSYPAALNADYGFQFSNTVRSVYAPVFRNALPELFEVFDYPDPSMVAGRRNASTVAPQAAFLLNHPFIIEQARYAAKTIRATNISNRDQRIAYAYRLSIGRLPTQAELELAKKALDPEDDEGWAMLFHALFASIDFRYIE